MSLNILHLTTHLNIGGISSYIHSLGKAQIQRGHRVSVLCSGGELLSDFQKDGIGSYVFPIRTKNEIHPRIYFHLLGILNLVRAQQFDVLHAHTRVTQVLSTLVSKATGVPYVSTAHGFYKLKLGRRIFPSWGDRVIAVSPLVADELRQSHGVNPERIVVAQNAVDIPDLERRLAASDRARVRERLGLGPDARVVTCISRLVEDKGQAYLIEAVLALKDRFPNLHLLIVGDGRQKPVLEKMAQGSGRIHFIPSQKEVADILKVTDIFAHPATYREGFGLAVAEAMIAERPVILTDIPAINAIFKHEETALVVPPKSARALAEAIASLIEDSARRDRVAQGGSRKARELCSLERLSGEVDAVYEVVLREKARRS